MQWLFRCYSDRDMIKYQCIKNKYRIHNIIYQFSQQLKDIMESKLTKVIVNNLGLIEPSVRHG